MNLRLTILGSGTSVGVPMAGCDCRVCRSSDPRDNRLRSSALLSWNGRNAVIDTTPEFRMQMLRAEVGTLDAVLITHNHHDHIHGLDDVRPYCFKRDGLLPVYASDKTCTWIRKHYDYIWNARQRGGGLPRIELHAIRAPFALHGLTVTPLPVMHGKTEVFGYRAGDIAYISDVSEIPPASWTLLEGVKTLVLDATRPEPHETHFHTDAAVDVVRRLGVERAVFTHLNHDLPHTELARRLPPGMEPAYDGMVIETISADKQAERGRR